MEPLATADDIIGAVDVDADTLALLLGRASSIVRAYAGVNWTDGDGELEDVPESIPGVVAAMVERALANPGGTTQEIAGPFQRSFGADAAQRLYLTRPEKTVIRFALGATGLTVISTTRGPVETASPVLCLTVDDDVTEIVP